LANEFGEMDRQAAEMKKRVWQKNKAKMLVRKTIKATETKAEEDLPRDIINRTKY
jgi:hypothetical protein